MDGWVDTRCMDACWVDKNKHELLGHGMVGWINGWISE